ncbi:peptidoglycan-binding domain-containing protein [Lentzea waywayandensis]|nr:peptidoglycan-binding domain-containing protein [Lentzea waywayandensis]
MKSIRATLAATAVLAAVIPMASPGVAQAAASCNSFTTYSVPGGFMRVPTIGWDTGAYNCDLGRGNFGDAVRVIQVSMRRCMGQNIADDRDFGPKTQQAVRNVQAKLNEWYNAGLAVDGRYGPKTRQGGFPFAVFPTFATWTPREDGYCYYRIDP